MKMRRSLWIIVGVLFVVIGATNAHADSFTPTFTGCTGACVILPSAPDVSFPSPTTIQVTWVSNVFIVPLVASDSPTDLYEWRATASIGRLEFDIFDFTNNTVTDQVLFPNPNTLLYRDTGILTFAAVSTPESSSVALMLAGIGFLLVMRKPIGQGLRQAS
jgi:hypothetical protein